MSSYAHASFEHGPLPTLNNKIQWVPGAWVRNLGLMLKSLHTIWFSEIKGTWDTGRERGGTKVSRPHCHLPHTVVLTLHIPQVFPTSWCATTTMWPRTGQDWAVSVLVILIPACVLTSSMPLRRFRTTESHKEEWVTWLTTKFYIPWKTGQRRKKLFVWCL